MPVFNTNTTNVLKIHAVAVAISVKVHPAPGFRLHIKLRSEMIAHATNVFNRFGFFLNKISYGMVFPGA